MKITKYICDCCGKEVKSENELEAFGIKETNLFKGEDNVNLYDICKECEDKLEEVIYKEFYKIKNENNKQLI